MGGTMLSFIFGVLTGAIGLILLLVLLMKHDIDEMFK